MGSQSSPTYRATPASSSPHYDALSEILRLVKTYESVLGQIQARQDEVLTRVIDLEHLVESFERWSEESASGEDASPAKRG